MKLHFRSPWDEHLHGLVFTERDNFLMLVIAVLQKISQIPKREKTG
jgi:hypothetical protein